jgi:hypothetical protein
MPHKAARRRSERRKQPRADARLSMRVEGHQEAGATQVVTESQNISASGVYCTSSHFLAPASRVALTLVLPKLPGGRGAKELIKCDGIVVRCEPSARKGDKSFELACMFSGLDERRRELLDEFVTWRNLQSLRAAASSTNGAVRKKTAAKKAGRKKVAAASAAGRSRTTAARTRKKAAARR